MYKEEKNLSSVQVAVRIRPLNDREASSTVITTVKNKTIHVVNPDDNKKKNFTFDYTYDVSSTQEEVYQDIGKKLIGNIFDGYNCCVFAYGQTGCGKSHTMMGSEQDRGLIPRICEALFDSRPEEPDVTYKIELSYLEIYSEEVRDLLVKTETNLKIRQHPEYGTYVEGLTQCVVANYSVINTLIEQGNKERMIASTLMNARSSRSHAIITLYITKITDDRLLGKKREIVSKVNLVDLAGSERVNSSGVQGINFKEAVNINQSLTALGIVISKLAANSIKKNKAPSSASNTPVSTPETKEHSDHIPFRDSVLTWILKESLGGNSKTFMIANVSPSSLNYNESLSTLRYAYNAKQIVNVVSVNEDPNDKIIKILRDEIETLRKQLQQQTNGAAPNPEIIESLKAEIAQREELMREKEKSWEQKLIESSKLQSELEGKHLEYAEKLDKSFASNLLLADEISKYKLTINTLENTNLELSSKLIDQEKSYATLGENNTQLQNGNQILLDELNNKSVQIAELENCNSVSETNITNLQNNNLQLQTNIQNLQLKHAEDINNVQKSTLLELFSKEQSANNLERNNQSELFNTQLSLLHTELESLHNEIIQMQKINTDLLSEIELLKSEHVKYILVKKELAEKNTLLNDYLAENTRLKKHSEERSHLLEDKVLLSRQIQQLMSNDNPI